MRQCFCVCPLLARAKLALSLVSLPAPRTRHNLILVRLSFLGIRDLLAYEDVQKAWIDPSCYYTPDPRADTEKMGSEQTSYCRTTTMCDPSRLSFSLSQKWL